MALLSSTQLEKKTKAPVFSLIDTHHKIWSLQQCMGPSGLVIAFICNHCPYVKDILQDMIEDAQALKKIGIEFAAIMSNDTSQYPEDSFENMAALAQKMNFQFPYLYDPSQQVATQYGAVCTPDFFGINADGSLVYKGRLRSPKKEQELLNFMRQIADNKDASTITQHPAMGCSIKWS